MLVYRGKTLRYIFSKVSRIQLVLKMNVDTKHFHKYRYFNTIINVYSSIIQPHFGHCWSNQRIIYWLEININWFIRMYQFLTKLWAQDFYETLLEVRFQMIMHHLSQLDKQKLHYYIIFTSTILSQQSKLFFKSIFQHSLSTSLKL